MLQEFYPDRVIRRLSQSEEMFWESRHLEVDDWQGKGGVCDDGQGKGRVWDAAVARTSLVVVLHTTSIPIHHYNNMYFQAGQSFF